MDFLRKLLVYICISSKRGTKSGKEDMETQSSAPRAESTHGILRLKAVLPTRSTSEQHCRRNVEGRVAYPTGLTVGNWSERHAAELLGNIGRLSNRFRENEANENMRQ